MKLVSPNTHTHTKLISDQILRYNYVHTYMEEDVHVVKGVSMQSHAHNILDSLGPQRSHRGAWEHIVLKTAHNRFVSVVYSQLGAYWLWSL